MVNFAFCLDTSKDPVVITRWDSPNAPSGLDRHEFATEDDSRESIMKAAKTICPDRNIIFEEGF
jgi:hypothetical protein